MIAAPALDGHSCSFRFLNIEINAVIWSFYIRLTCTLKVNPLTPREAKVLKREAKLRGERRLAARNEKT